MTVTKQELRLRMTRDAVHLCLLEALENLNDVQDDLLNPDPRPGYDRKVLSIDVFHCCDAGGETSHGVEVDVVTGRRIADAARGIIQDRLKEFQQTK